MKGLPLWPKLSLEGTVTSALRSQRLAHFQIKDEFQYGKCLRVNLCVSSTLVDRKRFIEVPLTYFAELLRTPPIDLLRSVKESELIQFHKMASNNSGEGAETVEIAELNAVKSITNDEEIVEKGKLYIVEEIFQVILNARDVGKYSSTV